VCLCVSLLEGGGSGTVNRLIGWLTVGDSYLSVVTLVVTVVVFVVVGCVVCCRRPLCSSKSSLPQTQRGGGAAPATSSVTTTTYLPAGTSSGVDEYTRCFVAAAPRRLVGTAAAAAAEWTNGSPSATSHGLVGVVVPTATASSSPRQPLVAVPPSLPPRTDVKYRFYDEC